MVKNKKTIVLVDGGFLRVQAKKAGKTYNPDFIEKFSLSCATKDEEIHRILYYDCAPFVGTPELLAHADFKRSVPWP